MFSKKSILIIAVMAIMLIGSVALNAAFYYVHVTSNHSGTGTVWLEDEETGEILDSEPVDYIDGTIHVTLYAETGIACDAHADGTYGLKYDHDWDDAQPFGNTYLELDLKPVDPNKTPSNY